MKFLTNFKWISFLTTAFLAILLCEAVLADTVIMKKGNKFEGVILKEDAGSVELEMSSGTAVFNKKQIKEILRSKPEELALLRDNMKDERDEFKAQEKLFDEVRERRGRDYEEWVKDGLQKKQKESYEPHEVPLLKVEDSKIIMVEAVINGRVGATLILDTGASDIVLTRKTADKLGLDLKGDIIEIQLAGRRRQAKTVMLSSIRIKNVEETDLMARVLLEDVDVMGLKDGLLGLEFLNRFQCAIDLGNNKMILKKKER